ncbi:hypothetical protein ACU4GA_12130 [Methylobacterium oryzae CBMB20]
MGRAAPDRAPRLLGASVADSLLLRTPTCPSPAQAAASEADLDALSRRRRPAGGTT